MTTLEDVFGARTSKNVSDIFQKIGLAQKEAAIYVTLLQSGPTSLRKAAESADLNRGAAYAALKNLMKKGLVSLSDKDKHRFFHAENPELLSRLIKDKRRELVKAKYGLEDALPRLKALAHKPHIKPSIRLYEGEGGIKTILEDVLETMKKDASIKEYYVYSAAPIREYLYSDFASFSDRRVELGIKVKVIALGKGGELRGLDERRWLSKISQAPSYLLLYHNKVTMISLNPHKIPIGLIIEDQALFQTQKQIFEEVWRKLS